MHMVVVGVDPYKHSHTAVAVDHNGRELGQITVSNTPRHLVLACFEQARSRLGDGAPGAGSEFVFHVKQRPQLAPLIWSVVVGGEYPGKSPLRKEAAEQSWRDHGGDPALSAPRAPSFHVKQRRESRPGRVPRNAQPRSFT
jgi:hypothetical protein